MKQSLDSEKPDVFAQRDTGATLNYIGSKYKLLPFIEGAITQTVGDMSDLVFADVFAGTGVVAKHFKGVVKQVIANDMEPYSYVLIRNYIGNRTPFEYEPLIAELNALDGVAGKIFEHYCVGGGTGRQYFSDANGQKIDAIRQTLRQWRTNGRINEDEFYFLLCSLLESADKVANVASVYGAYLKHLKATAQRPLELNPAFFETTSSAHTVHQADANALIREIAGDILYLDPPYNHRQYGANYHLLNTITLYDDFAPRGKTGLREYESSDYCSRQRATATFETLIAQAQFRYIFLSYNNEGIMSLAEVEAIMSKYGRYALETTGYQRFKADRDVNRAYKAHRTEEYLHILEKA